MASAVFICIRNTNGCVNGIFCHRNGELQYAGKTLNDYYFDKFRIERLLELGCLLYLGPTIGTKIDKDADYPIDEQCIAMHRDLERDYLVYEDYTLESILHSYSYIYIYEDGAWFVYDHGRKRLLSEALEELTNTKYTRYLVERDEGEASHFRAKDVNSLLSMLAFNADCNTELFERALKGMETDRQRIDLFNQFVSNGILHIYVIAREIGEDDEDVSEEHSSVFS